MEVTTPASARLAQIMPMVNESSASIYTLGIFDENDDDRNPRVLRELSRASGGEAFFPESLEKILPICQKIANDIRNQYTLTYESTNNNSDGTYRAIEVKASNSDGHGRLVVNTRAGYLAPLHLPAADGARSGRP